MTLQRQVNNNISQRSHHPQGRSEECLKCSELLLALCYSPVCLQDSINIDLLLGISAVYFCLQQKISRETDAFVQSFLTENEQRGSSLDAYVSSLPPPKHGKTLLDLSMASMVSPGHLLLLKMRLKVEGKN